MRLAGGMRGGGRSLQISGGSISRSALPYLPIASLFILLWPIKRHLQRQTVKLTIAGDKLRYETGLASKSMRIIQLPKVQDVRVLQSLGQRMFGVGDISIETAGENSRLVVENLDRPRELAEQITDASTHSTPDGLTLNPCNNRRFNNFASHLRFPRHVGFCYGNKKCH